MKKSRIFIVDDHEVVREGFISLLQENEKYFVSGEAGNGREALEKIQKMEFKPHVVLMDINMPEMNGMACTQILSEHFPDIKVIALTMIRQHAHISKMLEAGAVGYILKSGSKVELYQAIDTVLKGQTYFSPTVSDEVMRHLTRLGPEPTQPEARLSDREMEVLKLILDDFSNQQMAEHLGISVRTIETHKKNLLIKTGTKSVAGLVVYTLKHKLLDEDPSS